DLSVQFAQETGLNEDVALRALQSKDPQILRLAQSVVELGNTRAGWHADMRRHRKNILRFA
ncbi:MAG TPA: hypothetical protein VJT75_11160, partial [Thermoleophilaceae bacterium]|nr:hypothetical protein [Thermoleophilaceae bacterium]